MSRPPRAAAWVLRRALPPDVREDVTGDVLELYRRHLDAEGAFRAGLWFWRQSASFTIHFAAERFRDWRRTTDMSTGFSTIDFRLALRMLIRYPGLALVSVIGMAVGIAIAAAALTVVHGFLNPSLPLPEGDRIVALQNWDAATNNAEVRSMRDFAIWKRELQSVEDLGAFRTVGRNLIAPGAQPETVTIAELSASGFRVAGVQPLLGRYLLDEDERPDAAPAVVIGEDVWRRRFGGDPQVIGQTIQLGGTHYAIVGVMPAHFGFPINHRYWIPWQMTPDAYPFRSGPSLNAFARLRPGVALETANAELTGISRRLAAESPATHQHVRSRVLPYSFPFTDMDDPDGALVMHAIRTAVLLLLALVCVNVAILVYARTATRQGEIAIRTALGASRRRVVMQLFVEALVLSGVAALVGIGLVGLGFGQLERAYEQLAGPLPFWIDLELSTKGILYVAGLTLLASAIVGVLPALKATGMRVQGGLQGVSAGSGARMQMGRLWTALIIVQVAVAVGLLPPTVVQAWNALRFRTGDPGFARGEFLTAGLAMDRADAASAPGAPTFAERYGARQAELERRLEAEGPVSAVTFALTLPGEELAAVLEVEGMAAPGGRVDYNIVTGSRQGHLVRFNRVATDFFAAFDVPVLMGRSFDGGDAGPGRETVLIDRVFAERFFGGRNPLGRRVRYVGISREAGQGNVALDRWYEIVGVVETTGVLASGSQHPTPRLFHAVSPGGIYPALLSVRIRGAKPGTFATRLREVAAQVDPMLQLRDLSTSEDALRREQGLMRMIGVVLSVTMASVLVLSAAGIHALMSFTVARRRREIGIRAALGADPRHLLTGIFARAFVQLGTGAALGMAAAIAIDQASGGGLLDGRSLLVLPIVAVAMTGIGLLAAYGPARRGLAIQPTEALRAE
jgi:putative ABC transport system permease protein